MTKRSIIAVAVAAGLISAYGANAQDDSDAARLKKLEAAVDQLQQENTQLKQQVGAINVTDSASAAQSLQSKIILSAPVKEMDIYGEFRLRYFLNEAEVDNTTVSGERNRMRYRLRVGDNIKLSDNWMVGLLFETNNSAHSANVTLGNSASNAADSEVFNKGTVSTSTSTVTGNVVGINPATGKPVVGTAVKSGTVLGSTVSSVNFQDTLFVGQAYLKYAPFDWVTLEGGKMPNPYSTSRMVWDPDIYPEGMAEKFKVTLGPWGGGKTTTAGYSKDDGKSSKDVVAPAEQGGMTLDLFGNFGQFIYEDDWVNNFSLNTASGQYNTPQQSDIWQLGFQLGAKLNIDKNTSFQVAPVFYTYTGAGSAFAGSFSGDGPTLVQPAPVGGVNQPLTLVFPNEVAVNSLNIIDIPAEFDFKAWNIPMRIFGEFADNLSAQDRANGAGHPNAGGEGKAYQIGAGIGKIKKAHDWELLGWWQHSEQYSLDSNLIDDDIFDGRLNMQGFYLQATYAFTDSVSIVVQGSRGRIIDAQLGTAGEGALGDPAGLPLQEATQFYVDLSLKF